MFIDDNISYLMIKGVSVEPADVRGLRWTGSPCNTITCTHVSFIILEKNKKICVL